MERACLSFRSKENPKYPESLFYKQKRTFPLVSLSHGAQSTARLCGGARAFRTETRPWQPPTHGQVGASPEPALRQRGARRPCGPILKLFTPERGSPGPRPHPEAGGQGKFRRPRVWEALQTGATCKGQGCSREVRGRFPAAPEPRECPGNVGTGRRPWAVHAPRSWELTSCRDHGADRGCATSGVPCNASHHWARTASPLEGPGILPQRKTKLDVTPERDHSERPGVTVPVLGQRGSGQSDHGGENVHVAGWLVDLQASLDHSWPPKEARDTDAAFPVVGFAS